MAFCTRCGSPLLEGNVTCTACGNTNSPVSILGQAQAQLRSPHLSVDRDQIAIASQIATGAAASIQYQTAVQRQCPQCAHTMIVVFRRSRAPLIFFVIGFLILLIPFIGWIIGPCLIITGFILLLVRKGKARYQCPNCNYST